MKRPARPGLLRVATRELALDAARRGRAPFVDHRSGDRLRRPDLNLQQRRHPQSQGHDRRRRSLGDFAHLRPGARVGPRRQRRRTFGRHDERDEGDPLRRDDRRRLHPGEFRTRSPCPPAPPDRDTLQPAIFHPRQQRQFHDRQCDRRGYGHAAAGRRRRRLPARRPCLRAIRPLEPGIELRAVPAARDPADRAARRRSAGGRLRRRLGVLAPQQTRVVARRGRSSAGRADRQAHAAVRPVRPHGGRRRRHSARLVRRLVSRRSRHGRGGRMPACSRLSRARGAARSADAESGLGPEPDRHLLQPGLRLRRRRISDRRDERLRPRLGRDPASALVSARSCSIRPRAAYRLRIRSGRS